MREDKIISGDQNTEKLERKIFQAKEIVNIFILNAQVCVLTLTETNLHL